MRPFRHVFSAGLVAALTAAALVGAATPAAAAETYPRPASGSWEVDGRGWGHGWGMSQWGAQGAAEQGLGYREILAFYYPGTQVGTVSNTPLQVRLMAHQDTSSVTLWAPAGATGLSIAGAGDRTRSYAGGSVQVDRQNNHFRVRHTTASGTAGATHTFAATELTVSAPNAGGSNVGAVVGSNSTTGTWYRGTIQLVRENNTLLDVRNRVGLEQYLRGVVPREVPASWHGQALRAQAVAARSYVLAETPSGLTCDTTSCQVYGGRAVVNRAGTILTPQEHARTDSAIADTAGEVRWHSGAPAFTQFSSTNGGYSVAGSKPYLVARPDPYTGTAAGDTRSRWSDRLPVSRVEAYCPSNGRLEELVVVARDGNGAWGGRISEARLECSTGTRTLTNQYDLRFGMFSQWWRVRPPATGFFVSNTLGTEAQFVFQYGRDEDEVFIGDWDGNGTDTIMLRRGKTFHVSNTLRSGGADYAFDYGRVGDDILIGDWDGDGRDTIAVRRGREYHIRNDNRGGPAQQVITYGHADDDVLAGDWDGNERDTLAVRRGSEYHVKNSLRGGPADVVVHYGRADDDVLVGDWNGNGRDTLGVRRGQVYHLKNVIAGGDADVVVSYGRTTDEVYVGDWDGNGTDTLSLRRLS